MRQPRAVALAVLLAAGCAGVREALAPAPRPWPVPKDGRVRRDGRILRAYGASLKSRAEADRDARARLEEWLWRLPLGEGYAERAAAVKSVLDSDAAKPVPSPVPEVSGYSSVIELDLHKLQKTLGTHYD